MWFMFRLLNIGFSGQAKKKCLVISADYNKILLVLVSCAVNALIFLSMARQPLVGQGLLIVEALRLHSDTPHLIELLWTGDQPERRDLYLRKHNTDKRQTSMPPAGFEPTFPASERPQTHALARAAAGIGNALIK
jgi:hypothetical protein